METDDQPYQAWEVTITCVVTHAGFDPTNDHIEVHGKDQFDPQYHVVDVEAVPLVTSKLESAMRADTMVRVVKK